MKGTPSDLLKGFDIPHIKADCKAGRFVTLNNVRLLKVSTKDPNGIPGDFEYIEKATFEVLKKDRIDLNKVTGVKYISGEFVKYVPLTTEAYYLSIQKRPDNMKVKTIELKIEEIKISVRLPEYAAKLFRSNTDDGENVVLKAMSKPYQVLNEHDEPVTVWEGIIAMFSDGGTVVEPAEVFEAAAYTDFMDDKIGTGKHADLPWKDASTEYLEKAQHSFVGEQKVMAMRELDRRKAEKEPAGVTE